MAQKKGSHKGSQGFDVYYSQIYGKRWPNLKSVLAQDVKHTKLTQGLKLPYYMDEASVIAALMLGVKPGETVLDLCAAPGGKSLVLLHELSGSGSLTVNEFSGARRARLKKVMAEHVNPEHQDLVTLKPFDARKWCLYEQEAYDKILLDAPCSSERHVLNSEKHLSEWSPSRIKRLAQQQYTMLVSALEVVRVGGTILYSTCALSREENDGVIAKLLKKRKDQFEVISEGNPPGEKTEYGRLILPDFYPGMGPIYYCKIKRQST